MVDAPIPRPYKEGPDARAKDELRKKLNQMQSDPENQIRNLIRSTPRLPQPTVAEQEASPAEVVKRIKKASELSIVSSDHEIEDSPNASHINENLGKSVAMIAVKTIGKRKSISDNRSRPLGKRIKSRYVYEDVPTDAKLKYTERFRENLMKESEVEVSDDENSNSPKEKNTKPEKRGNLVTINPKLNDNK
jgi:hypothetical protein